MFLRIEGGALKGRFIRSVNTKVVRPLPSLVRKAIFDSISVENLSVADLFAGTGIFGIEALSRGAKYVLFVEKQKTLCRNIEENIKKLGLENSAEVVCSDCESILKKLPESKFDLVFVDPPFNHKITKEFADNIIRVSSWLVILRRRKETDENYYRSLFNTDIKIKNYSDSIIFFLFTQKKTI